jgi:N-acetylmuramic acid 6-phosphate etherase
MQVRSKWQSLPTEAINPSSLDIDKLGPDDIVDLMINEDRKMLAAVQRERERIAVGVEMIASTLRKGGRIIFVGAGTSGRLGILESAEMPPTFSTDPSLVQAIMAGGRDAIFAAKEGVEDNYEEGARSITRVRPTKKDVVVGVSASGMTQFVRGALTRARKTGARIIFVTCDPGTELQTFVDLTISPGVGAEVIAGSTRLKAGTATKLVLNMLTTGAMIRIGKTYGNLMVDVQTGSEKLKDRARRIVNIVTGLDYEDADRILKRAHWNVKAAIVMQKTSLPYPKALSRLRKAHDSMREALDEDIEPRLRGLLQGHAEAAASIIIGLPRPGAASRTPAGSRAARAPRTPRQPRTPKAAGVSPLVKVPPAAGIKATAATAAKPAIAAASKTAPLRPKV